MSSTENLSQTQGQQTNQGQQQQQQQQEKEAPDFRKNFNYPLVRYTDMGDEVRAEVIDLCVSAIEKHSGNFENGAKVIKESMDKKMGSNWHVVIGEGFAFEITHEMRNLMYMFFGGNMGILLWKAS